MRATAIGAACAPWWCSFRGAARICATIAASAVSGRAGGTAIPVSLRQGAGAAAPRTWRQSDQLRRRESDRVEKAWQAFLEALIAENVDLTLVGSTRADDIVRDADILHLYKKAGWQRFLLGMENTDEKTLQLIRKGGATATDREAIRLMRQHGILSMATWVVGFEEETDRDHWRGLRQLLSYDPDQIQMLYVTPHRWTPYFRLAEHRTVIQTDRRRWDYKHQVAGDAAHAALACAVMVQVHRDWWCSRPKALYRNFFQPDAGPAPRHAMVYTHGPPGLAL